MSENYKQRSILEIMNDVLGTIRDYYDSEYVYYIERDEEEILTIYEWCAEFVPWQRDKIKMLDKEQCFSAIGRRNYGSSCSGRGTQRRM